MHRKWIEICSACNLVKLSRIFSNPAPVKAKASLSCAYLRFIMRRRNFINSDRIPYNKSTDY